MSGSNDLPPVSGEINTDEQRRAEALLVVHRHCGAAWKAGARDDESTSDVRIGLAALKLWVKSGDVEQLDQARRAFAAAAETDSRYGLAKMAVHLIASWHRLSARKGGRMNALAHRDVATLSVERACELLAKATRVDEVKKIHDTASAMRLYLRQQKASLKAQNDAAAIAILSLRSHATRPAATGDGRQSSMSPRTLLSVTDAGTEQSGPELDPRAIWESPRVLREMAKLHGQPLRGRYEWHIDIGGGRTVHMYLSGLPYMWTTYPERAFAFGSRAQASTFAKHLGKRYRIVRGRAVAAAGASGSERADLHHDDSAKARGGR